MKTTVFQSNAFDTSNLTLEEKALLEGKVVKEETYQLPFSLGAIDTFKERYEYFKRNEIGTYYYITANGNEFIIETVDGVLPTTSKELYNLIYDIAQRRYSYIYEDDECETEIKQLSFLLDILKGIQLDEFLRYSLPKRLTVEDVLKFKILIHNHFDVLGNIDYVLVVEHILPLLVGCYHDLKPIIYKALRLFNCHHHLKNAIYLLFEEDKNKQVMELSAKEIMSNLKHYSILFGLLLNQSASFAFIEIPKGLNHHLIKLILPSADPKRIITVDIKEGDYCDLIEVQYSTFLVGHHLLTDLSNDLKEKIVNQIKGYLNLKSLEFK